MKRPYLLTFILALLGALAASGGAVFAADAAPPSSTVKLVFVHHSTGGNWLADPNEDQPHGGLGRALMENNYYVSATNYGWGPFSIGDSTDIPNWPRWFTGSDSGTVLSALYGENGQNIGDFGSWPRLAGDPGGENEVVMIKSCFPNSDLYGNPDDPAAASPGDQYTVSNAKAVYNDLLTYFGTRADRFFVVVTAPPQNRGEYGDDIQTPDHRAANARAFTGWLVNEWLKDYPHRNVMVFDYFNVLTGTGNHHRWNNGQVEHITAEASNFPAYPTGEWDSHPNTEGHTKAAGEFVPLLNYYYNLWKAGGGDTPPPVEETPPGCSITANESGTPGPVTTGGEIRLRLSLSPGDFEGRDADWWFVAVMGNTPYSFNPVTMTFEEGLFPVHRGGLQALADLHLTTLRPSGQGEHVFYFGVDTLMNGELDLELLTYSAVSITVTP